MKNPKGRSAKSRDCSRCGVFPKQMRRETGEGNRAETKHNIRCGAGRPSRSWQTGGCTQASFWEMTWACVRVFACRSSRRRLPVIAAVSNVLPLDQLDFMCSCALTKWGTNCCTNCKSVTSHGNYDLRWTNNCWRWGEQAGETDKGEASPLSKGLQVGPQDSRTEHRGKKWLEEKKKEGKHPPKVLKTRIHCLPSHRKGHKLSVTAFFCNTHSPYSKTPFQMGQWHCKGYPFL